MEHAYGPPETRNVMRLREMNASLFREIKLYKYNQEANLVEWDQHETLRHWVPREVGDGMGKRREPKVARWIREMLFDYDNSRWNLGNASV